MLHTAGGAPAERVGYVESSADKACSPSTAVARLVVGGWLGTPVPFAAMGDDVSALSSLCSDVEMPFSAVSPDVRARLSLLDQHSETIRDAQRILRLARAVFEHYEKHKSEQAFNTLEQRIVLIGSLFADLGKTGPPNATEAEQRLIVEMFSVEGVRDDQQPVSQFLAEHFPADASEREARFSALGLDARMPMRAFWNLHAGWTLEVARSSGLPPEAVAAAASHHLLDNVNPGNIVTADGRYSADFGENVAFDRAEKLVILLDKYDALLRRGRRTHDEAIAWLGGLIARHPRFADDRQLSTLLDDLDVVGRSRHA